MDKVMEISSKNGVVIFGKSSCAMSQAVQLLFQDLGVNPTIFEIDNDPESCEIETALVKIGCSTPVPTIFVGGRLVGSNNEVMSLHQSGKLVPLVMPFQNK